VLVGDITSLNVIHLLSMLFAIRRTGSFLELGLFRNWFDSIVGRGHFDEEHACKAYINRKR
jgi:hypothetical protein